MKKRILGGVVAMALVAGLSLALANAMFLSGNGTDHAQEDAQEAQDAASPIPAAETGAGVAARGGLGFPAMEQAAEDGKYLFAVFWRDEDDQTATMQQVVAEAVTKMPDRAASVAVRVTDPAEAALIDKFGLNRAPMPLVLAIAPSGAVTGGFPSECNEEDLLGAFASPGTEQTIKALQDGKLVLLCLQGPSTQQNDEALKGVNDFQADSRFANTTQRVIVDPADTAEASFLQDLRVDASTDVAMTLVLVPPGSIAAVLEGGTTKEDFLAALRNATPHSCGPGGCSH